MKKSLYEQTMDSVKAPERVVEHMLSAVRDSEKKEKIIPMKNRKSNHIKRNVIAASLALALLLGAVFGISALSPKESPFVITVNAAEISDSGYTPVGTLNGVGGDFHEENDGEVSMSYDFIFNVRVNGKNVSDVLYMVENGSIGAQGGNKKSLNQSEVISVEEDEKMFTRLGFSADTADATLSEEARQAIRDWFDHARTKLEMPALQEDYDDSKFSIADCTSTLYTALLERVSVEAKITYTDGTAETKKLVFACDSVTEDGVATISAKLV